MAELTSLHSPSFFIELKDVLEVHLRPLALSSYYLANRRVTVIWSALRGNDEGL
jgi:hypothetical protein